MDSDRSELLQPQPSQQLQQHEVPTPMKVNATLKAISSITTTQQVAANNIANMLTNGFKASQLRQSGDTITISQASRSAIQKNEAASSATTTASTS
ncbi:MAG: hypothetical protein Q9M13_08950, partial [Mariprofundales bacterium]|nr:hypothetical protein [Mariprofundales bacterium]